MFTQPNGLAFSPDEKSLYVGDSKDRLIRKFSVENDGTLSNPVLFLDVANDPRPGAPDGMKVDSEGRLWTTGPGGVWVIEPDGTILGQIEIPELPANIAFGSTDYKTIFLTARTSVYSIDTHVNGIVPPKRS
jgi:gluconolactonase